VKDPDAPPLVSRFTCVRVIAAHAVRRDRREPREEWLIVDRPKARTQRPTQRQANRRTESAR